MGKLPRPGRSVASPIDFLPAGDVVEDQLGDVGVVADDDEDRRREAAGPCLGVLLPQAVILLVVAVEAVERALAARPAAWARPPIASGLAALLGQVLADAQPQVAVGRLLARIESSATGTRGTLTMPASMASISEKSETTQGKSVPSG